MEREFSVQSISSRGNSELTSPRMEPGFFMTSFAGTIFIGALVAVGILFVTLLVALAVMLQSCESKNAGIVEIKSISADQNFCRIFTLHAELNSLQLDAFPSVCRDLAILYVRGGQYERDLNISVEIAESYFSTLTPSDDGLDVVVIDIEDILSLQSPHINQYLNRYEEQNSVDYIKEAEHLKHMFILKLYMKLQARGWSLILTSRKPDQDRKATTEHLTSAGFRDWFSLIMRFDDETQVDSREFFCHRKQVLQNKGCRIMGMISSQMDALTGPCSGEHVFKIPNLMHHNHNLHYQLNSTREPQ